MQEAIAADPTLPATRSLLRRPLSFACCHYGINIDNRWPNGITCPACGSDNVKERSAHLTMPHRCNSCRKFLSVKHGTAMQSSKIGYQDWAVAIHIVATGLKGTSSMKVHRDLGECPHEYPCSEDAVIGPPTVTRIAAVLPQPTGMMPTRCFRAVRRGEPRAVDILPRYRKSARPRASFGSPRSGEGSGSRPKMTLSPPEWLHSKWTRRAGGRGRGHVGQLDRLRDAAGCQRCPATFLVAKTDTGITIQTAFDPPHPVFGTESPVLPFTRVPM